MKREGYFENGRVRGGALNQLYPLPPEVLDGRVKDGFTYPVLVYGSPTIRSEGGFYMNRIAGAKGYYRQLRALGCGTAALLAVTKTAVNLLRTPLGHVTIIDIIYRTTTGGRRR